ncbi:hypothetical protein AURANDRAFT_67685 [Aureococcus anophagefferens]|uniref:Uncharacterized protein n=1 Tax=Aureococcus anophagefferens TaxID=44056 RepID=F0YM21_AURAN|nr:hypothetical protein AURANDRAFT_67685 [Aureococcus anophagefferens]EGB03839.1 hypothetical protein AURANDRAFT_67685 [Aureococcus anophagefferens]|eukprot:XP_009041497.1 hypothetical protein AURANDRAFT_67685 [Aureococcus anophagefferens]
MGSRDAAKVGKTPSELPPALSGLTAALNAAHATRLASDARAVSSAFARAEHFSFDLLEPDDADVELTFEQRYEQEYLHAEHDGASAKSAASCADEADFHVREFLRFLALKSVRPDVTPSVVVDNVFHLALTYTVAYAHLCALVGGTFIHHDPTPGGDAANARYMRQYEDALELYALAFGAPPPRSVWPPVAERMDPQRDYVSLPRSRVQELRAAAMKSNIIGGDMYPSTLIFKYNKIRLRGGGDCEDEDEDDLVGYIKDMPPRLRQTFLNDHQPRISAREADELSPMIDNDRYDHEHCDENDSLPDEALQAIKDVDAMNSNA